MAYLVWLTKILLLTALAIIMLLLLNYCSMYWENSNEGSVGSTCQYDQKQQRKIAVEHYQIQQGEKVALPLHEADCLKH